MGISPQTRNIVVLASKTDSASVNIGSHLLPYLDQWRASESGTHSSPRMLVLEGDLVSAERYPDGLSPKPDLAIFASRHQSESGMPCLSLHFPGNIAESHHGGRSRCLSTAAPLDMRKALCALASLSADPAYRITLEATHHGPLTKVPCFFIEIGSGPAQWEDGAAGDLLAKAILRVLTQPVESAPVVTGFGGPHYSQGFTNLVLKSGFSVSHIVPKHQIGYLDDGMIAQLFERSAPRPEVAVLDWKGIKGEERRRLTHLLDGAGVRWARLQHLLSGRNHPRSDRGDCAPHP